MKRLRASRLLTSVPLILAAFSATAQLASGTESNTILVAKSGGDFQSIQAALDSITDATASNRYLIRVAPGVYNEQVLMKRYVDLEGAGKEITRVASDDYCTVQTSAYSGLRSLTVECDRPDAACAATCGGWVHETRLTDLSIRASARWVIGMEVSALRGLTLERVTIQVDPNSDPGGCSGTGMGTPPGWNRSAQSGPSYVGLLNDVTIEVSNLDCQNVGISSGRYEPVEIRNSHILVEGTEDSIGLSSYGGSVDLHQVRLRAPRAISGSSKIGIQYSHLQGDLESWGNTIQLCHSMFGGVVLEGTPKCYSVHDADLNPLDETCQPSRKWVTGPSDR